MAPTGGTISTSGNFRIHTFNTSDNFVTTLGMDVEYLIIKRLLVVVVTTMLEGLLVVIEPMSLDNPVISNSAESSMTLTAATYPVVVGAGGAARQLLYLTKTGNDGMILFNFVTSLGGGGGASSSGGGNTPNSGGSGGGAAGVTIVSGVWYCNQGFVGGGSSGTSNQYGRW